MIDEIAQGEAEGPSAVLKDMHQFVEQQFKRQAIEGIYPPAALRQIHSIPQRQSGKVPAGNNPPERNSLSQPEVDLSQLSNGQSVRNPGGNGLGQKDSAGHKNT